MSDSHPLSMPLPELMTGCLRTPLGDLFARPWFDRLALRALGNWFFPLSRLWAAARVADGSVEAYFNAVPLQPSLKLARQIERKLRHFEKVRLDVHEADEAWQHAFFGPAGASNAELARLERQRLAASNRYNALRWSFATLGVRDKISAIAWDIPEPDTVEKLYGPHVADADGLFAAPGPMPEVAVSQRMKARHGVNYWLHFASPSERMNDQVTARVYEPDGAENPPTLIFGHGICVEFDHWRGMIDDVEDMVRLGFRVVRPEAPWHGRRVPKGRYGGETFIATAPLGALDLFTGAAREWSVLMDWCRRNTTAPVAVGGSSLGAMTAQLVGDRSQGWPDRLQPDAMFLVTHCGRIEDAVTRGSLARVWGVHEATTARGWTPEMVGRYLPLLNPRDELAVPADKVVTVLGSRDEATPFDSGKALIERWQVPAENAFIWPLGHFSVPVGLLRDPRPLRRLRTIMLQMA